MSRYFTIEELCRSQETARRGIDNTPQADIAVKLTALAERVLDPVRELWGKPVLVNSGYRCAVLNKAVGGAANSQHMTGEAADISTGSVEGNRKLFDMISKSAIPFDQLIDEKKYSWIHISYGPRNRKQILHL